MKLNRRSFIAGLPLIAGGGYLSWTLVSEPIESKIDITDISTYPEDLPIENVTGIGKFYLQENNLRANEQNRVRLIEELSSGSIGSQLSFRTLMQDHSDVINELIRNDLQSENFCMVDGWKLAKSECLLSAIAYIELGEFRQRQFPEIPYDLPKAQLGNITKWGPDSTPSGEAFNPQPNGNSALWLQFSELPNADYIVYFGDHEMITTLHSNGLITADLKPVEAIEATINTGIFEISLVDKTQLKRQVIGEFEVTGTAKTQFDRSDPETYTWLDKEHQLQVLRWGPQFTTVGKGFNLQSDGSSAFWVRIKTTSSKGMKIALGKTILQARHHQREGYDLLTATISPDNVNKVSKVHGSHPLYLLMGDRRQLVGIFEIRK